jgi:succinoglycan biosynthesis protein ExoM
MDHITVCICTFKRPHMLGNLLKMLQCQPSDGKFDISASVVDNDANESARETVSAFSAACPFPVAYACEPEQNIARARNRAVENASGNFIAFIDDDEFPDDRWLVRLYDMAVTTGAAGVLGPVLPSFQVPPAKWIVQGRIFDRPSNKTGEILQWEDTRTGNVLLRRELFSQGKVWFDASYGRGGEDRDFFRRMIAAGNTFIWCNEAVAWEAIPLSRCTRGFQLKRALLRGKAAMPVPFSNLPGSAKSCLAILAYLPVLPVMFILSQGLFMRYLIKTFDHIGLVLAFFGANVIKKHYLS